MTSPPRSPEPVRAAWSRWVAAGACALAGVLVWQFWGNAVRGYIDTSSVFWWWGWQWFNEGSESEHGPLIVALAVWMGWRNLTKFEGGRQKSEVGPRWPALVAMGAGLALHVIAFAVQQTRLSIVALLVFAWGVMRLGGGARWGRAMVFPLGLLLFAVPMNFLDSVGFHLRLAVIQATEWIAQGVGIDVVRNGTQLSSPDGQFQYDVAAACSGVRSLMALMALSCLIGYLELRTWGRRAAVFLLCFPLTYLGNVVRITGIVLIGEWVGHSAGAWVHEYAGFVVFVIVLGGVHLAASRAAESEPPARPERRGGAVASIAPAHGAWIAVIIVVGLAATAVALIGQIQRVGAAPQAGVRLASDGRDPVDPPVFIGTEWAGRRAEVSAVERELLPPDTGYARRTYTRLDRPREQVFFSVVLSGRDRSSIHRPELCLVGQGWSIDARRRENLSDPRGGELPVTVLTISRELGEAGGRTRQQARFVYWFAGHDGPVATTAARMMRDVLNRLRLAPDRWAYVVAQTVIEPGESEADVADRIQTIVDGAWREMAR